MAEDPVALPPCQGRGKVGVGGAVECSYAWTILRARPLQLVRGGGGKIGECKFIHTK